MLKIINFSFVYDSILNEANNLYFINFFNPIFEFVLLNKLDYFTITNSNDNLNLIGLNFTNSDYYITVNEFLYFLQVFLTLSVIIIYNQITYYNYLFQTLDLNNLFVLVNIFSLNLFPYFWNVFTFFVIFLFFLTLFNNFLNNIELVIKKNSNFFYFYNQLLILWVNFVSIKFESYDEAISTFILWPWCIFLIFTHLVDIENHEVFFIFIEWGLPVVYGFILIMEYITNFGKYIFVYLNGAKGRSIFIITLIEDFIAFMIIFARIVLQVIRGILCGFFHDFFRELSDFLFDTWEYFWNYIEWELPFRLFGFSDDLFYFFIEWYSLVFALLFAYVILFLQLLFLFIAVWLFCKCWFISNKKFINIFKANEVHQQ